MNRFRQEKQHYYFRFFWFGAFTVVSPLPYIIFLAFKSSFTFLKDRTSSITCSVPNHTLEKLIKQLTEKKAWDKLHVLYLGGGGPQRYSPGEGGLATGIDASEIPLELVFDAGEKYRVPLIVALLENGAFPNGLGKKRESPLEMALEAEDYSMVVTLLQYNADPTCIVTKAGDSLLHGALKQLFATGVLTHRKVYSTVSLRSFKLQKFFCARYIVFLLTKTFVCAVAFFPVQIILSGKL